MKLEILDSTLRDGAQGEGINYVITDKIAIFKLLSKLEINFIEGGIAENVTDINFFNEINKNRKMYSNTDSKIVAFCSTMKYGKIIEKDCIVNNALAANTDFVSIVGKCSIKHVKNVLKVSLEDNINLVEQSVKYLVSNGKEVIFDAEHFFEAYQDNSEYALKVLFTAYNAGASRLVLCDTNGGFLPNEIYSITKSVCNTFKDLAIIGIHCHNDCGLAVSNTISAIVAGATHIQGTFLGYGERCGNANLSTIITILQLKMGYKILSDKALSLLTSTGLILSDISNKTLPANMPFIGRSAFTHKAGLHIDAMIKDKTGYETINPTLIGNVSRTVISQMSGKNAIADKLKSLFPNYSPTSKNIEDIAKLLKTKEAQGYIYESAGASLIMSMKKCINQYVPFFELINYKVISEYPPVDNNQATVTITIKVGDKTNITAGQGNGPVNAMDVAIRDALIPFYPSISNVSLVDYKVRVINPEDTTRAFVRVLITSTDGVKTWSTVGVSTDIIEASWLALRDSIEFYLT